MNIFTNSFLWVLELERLEQSLAFLDFKENVSCSFPAHFPHIVLFEGATEILV